MPTVFDLRGPPYGRIRPTATATATAATTAATATTARHATTHHEFSTNGSFSGHDFPRHDLHATQYAQPKPPAGQIQPKQRAWVATALSLSLSFSPSPSFSVSLFLVKSYAYALLLILVDDVLFSGLSCARWQSYGCSCLFVLSLYSYSLFSSLINASFALFVHTLCFHDDLVAYFAGILPHLVQIWLEITLNRRCIDQHQVLLR